VRGVTPWTAPSSRIVAFVRRKGTPRNAAHVRLDGGSVVFSNGGTLRQHGAIEREYIGTSSNSITADQRSRKALGIQRTNLYRKMRSLRVNVSKRRQAERAPVVGSSKPDDQLEVVSDESRWRAGALAGTRLCTVGDPGAPPAHGSPASRSALPNPTIGLTAPCGHNVFNGRSNGQERLHGHAVRRRPICGCGSPDLDQQQPQRRPYLLSEVRERTFRERQFKLNWFIPLNRLTLIRA